MKGRRFEPRTSQVGFKLSSNITYFGLSYIRIIFFNFDLPYIRIVFLSVLSVLCYSYSTIWVNTV